MNKKAKRKKHKKNQYPPLTFVDHCIYFICIILSVLAGMLLNDHFEDIRQAIAFSAPHTVAFVSSASSILSIPFLLFLLISLILPVAGGWDSKKPVFGSKKYKYGEYPFADDCFPLFSRNKKRVKKTPRKKKVILIIVAMWCVTALILASLVPFSLAARRALYDDNRVEKINLFNKVTATYTPDDFSRLTVRANFVVGFRGSGYWQYELKIKMKDGKTFAFCNRDFNRRAPGAKDLCLDKMLEIKELFDSDAIVIEGAGHIDRVSSDLDFNEQQYEKLKELFTS